MSGERTLQAEAPERQKGVGDSKKASMIGTEWAGTPEGLGRIVMCSDLCFNRTSLVALLRIDRKCGKSRKQLGSVCMTLSGRCGGLEEGFGCNV